MKAEEAILKLTTRPDLDQQVLDSPFFKFYRRIDMETCNEIAALIDAQAKVVDAAMKFIALNKNKICAGNCPCVNASYNDCDYDYKFVMSVKPIRKALHNLMGRRRSD
jgi:hypothetical protein